MARKPFLSQRHFRVHSEVFQSFLMGGFECSTFRRADGRRLDVIAATRHDEVAGEDYKRLRGLGLRVSREGVRWHLAEATPGVYDFSSAEPIIDAAEETDTQIIWDLCHFGWPDHIDILSPEFIQKLAAFAAAVAEWLLSKGRAQDCFVPINEISFFSWAGGEVGAFEPLLTYRGFELKRQLVRASLAACDALWSVHPRARIVHCDPVINVLAHPDHPEERIEAQAYHLSQYQSWDMISGRLCPELGGNPRYLDIVGVNFYPHNQWFYNLKDSKEIRPFESLRWSSPHYKPFATILHEVHERYSRPLFVAETGAESKLRAPWFRYVFAQTLQARASGIPVHGLCLYPIVNHPGWMDDRHCLNGLWDYAAGTGDREIYQPLAEEIQAAQQALASDASVHTNFLVDGFELAWEDAEAPPPPPQPVQARAE